MSRFAYTAACSVDDRCYRSDGHPGDHMYADGTVRPSMTPPAKRSEPSTAAGRVHVEDTHDPDYHADAVRDILAIEHQAAQAALRDAVERVARGMHAHAHNHLLTECRMADLYRDDARRILGVDGSTTLEPPGGNGAEPTDESGQVPTAPPGTDALRS